MKEIPFIPKQILMLITSTNFANLHYVVGRWGLKKKLVLTAMLVEKEQQVLITDALRSQRNLRDYLRM